MLVGRDEAFTHLATHLGYVLCEISHPRVDSDTGHITSCDQSGKQTDNQIVSKKRKQIQVLTRVHGLLPEKEKLCQENKWQRLSSLELCQSIGYFFFLRLALAAFSL